MDCTVDCGSEVLTAPPPYAKLSNSRNRGLVLGKTPLAPPLCLLPLSPKHCCMLLVVQKPRPIKGDEIPGR